MHIALVCPDIQGHLNPMTSLGRELLRQGHRVTVIGSPEAEERVGKAGLGFEAIAVAEYEAGRFAAERARLAELTGFAALKLTGQLLQRVMEINLRDLPAAMERCGIDGLVVDQVSPAASTAAEMTGRPFVIACNALALHQEPAVPPATVSWAYRKSTLARLRNRMGNLLLTVAVRTIYKSLNRFRMQQGLPVLDASRANTYGLAQIAQQPEFFDFPRERLPAHFHYTGPWHEPDRDHDVGFPFEKFDGRPLVYASLGTIQNKLKHVFQAILDGLATLDVQLVLSLGRREATWDGPVPANAIVVPFAPQLAVLDRAKVVITHAGLNTALETLARGKPMLCIPVTNDQPGVASRIRHLGIGEVCPPRQVTAQRIQSAVKRLLTDEHYQNAATYWANTLQNGPGVREAGEIVTAALTTRQRIDRPFRTIMKDAA